MEYAPLVYIVILNWNQYDLTRACLRSLAELDYMPYRVLVVDNGSTDGSVHRLRAEFADTIEVIANPVNLGYSGGNNVGIAHAVNQGADYVLLLNNDTLVYDPRLLSRLIECLQADRQAALVSPSIRYAHAPSRLWYAGAWLDLWRGWGHYHSEPVSDAVRECGYASGCCVLARASAIKDIGLLRDSYFLTMEDVEWSWRARIAGWRVLYAPGVSLLHEDGASSRDVHHGGVYSPARVYYEHRNAVWFVREYATGFQKWTVWPARWLVGWSYKVLAYTLLGRWAKLRALACAIRDGILAPVGQTPTTPTFG